MARSTTKRLSATQLAPVLRDVITRFNRRLRQARPAAGHADRRGARDAAPGERDPAEVGTRVSAVRAKLADTFRSLRVRNYRLFATGNLLRLIGTWMMFVAQDWLVLQLSGDSATAL